MASTKVKICGLTSVEDAVIAVDAGADAIGLVFYADSPRCVSIEIAREIVRTVGPFTTTVGLFVNAAVSELEQCVRETGVHVVQLHGDETPAYCRQMTTPYLRAIRVAPETDVAAAIAAYPAAAGYLMDAWHPERYGGTGECFDWHRVAGMASDPARVLILAGGLSVDNIVEAVQSVRPYAVDVSSGVESAPGKKDPRLVREFIARVRNVA
ncbi:MAG TPA: phosphoribosylanthranilate isomerase [Porticoccaceae bacterium]|nr:phosphoribosylanthranilate isomerase [Porticoccaceae bacterium]